MEAALADECFQDALQQRPGYADTKLERPPVANLDGRLIDGFLPLADTYCRKDQATPRVLNR